jgi:hypothetical protein
MKKTYSYAVDKILVTNGPIASGVDLIQQSITKSIEWYHAKLWIHNGVVLKNHLDGNLGRKLPIKKIIKNYVY